MFYISEENFVDKFLACLAKYNINSIPFDNHSFYRGVEEMSRYFQQNKEQLGKTANELSLLFLKSPLEGVFSRFRDAISEQNGWYISFENPEYTRGIIKISADEVDDILCADEFLSAERIVGFTKAFCSGAQITLL